MPPTQTTNCWSSAIAALTATRKCIGYCWRRSFRGRPSSRRLRDSPRPSELGGRRRQCFVSIAPRVLSPLDGKIACLLVPRIRHLSDRALASPYVGSIFVIHNPPCQVAEVGLYKRYSM